MNTFPPLTFLDLCAGIGGFSLGLEWAGMVCKGQVEIDEYCNRILFKHWPHVPKWGDITTLEPAALPATDLVCGGFPCQPVSQAGKRRGKADDRWLWPFFVKILAAKRPAWFFGENVAGIVNMELDAVFSDLESLGYETTSFNIPACAVGAEHKRERVWILAYSNSFRRQGRKREKLSPQEAQRRNAARLALPPLPGSGIPGRYALPTSRVCRGVDGIPGGLDRIKTLGNAVMPQLVCEIGVAIRAAHYEGAEYA